MRIFNVAFLALLLGLTSCVPVAVVGVGAAAGTYSARNETGLGGKISDLELASIVKKALIDNGVDTRYYSIVIKNAEVLVAGYDYKKEKNLIERIIKSDHRIKAVYNEISDEQISSRRGLEDGLLQTRVNGNLLVARDVHSLNYGIFVRNGVVFILGIAQTQAEFDKVIARIQSTYGVEKVVSYIKIMGRDIVAKQPVE